MPTTQDLYHAALIVVIVVGVVWLILNIRGR